MDPLSDVDTAELVARVRGGDQSAWVALTDRYTNLLWSVARGLGLTRPDAADVVQTTWLRLVERLDTLREPERLGSWLATTVRRESLATLRRGARVRVGLAEEVHEIPAGGEAMDDMLVRAERDAALWRSFRAMGPRCQSLLRALMADPPPSYAEVSAALEMPIGSIGPTRQRCLGVLRRIWQTAAESDVEPPEPNYSGEGVR
ncbi:RNA polymerase sigma factor [Rhizomonospora bruguierae]|uniref:RNA polymerase sigma factor n=1 Tax=Rhizomonospora bruguierae TaxID=1581705 RepID=UPI001BD0BD46|nr:sigma-70 family RNA polymerase sigma factor [Micromonospora sp. NBRC 107566]